MQYIILIFAIVIIILNVRAIKKEKGSFQSTLVQTSENMDEIDIKLGKIRNEFSETILELQKEIEYLKTQFNKEKANGNAERQNKDKLFEMKNGFVKNSQDNEDKNEFMDYNSINEEKSQNNKEIVDSNNIKINEIEKLVELGLSMEEISERLGIGKGEVLLIKELYLK